MKFHLRPELFENASFLKLPLENGKICAQLGGTGERHEI